MATRYLILTGILIGAVGVASHFAPWPLLTSTLGPTAYVFVAHPNDETSRWRNAVAGHAVAIAAGLVALAAFGLWDSGPIGSGGHLPFDRLEAATLAAGLTVLVLELLHSHHAPAAATTLLVATGLAGPGARLEGLVVGLVVVLALSPIAARIPFPPPSARQETDATRT